MSLTDDLNELEEDIKTLDYAITQSSLQESIINDKIASLRLELARQRDVAYKAKVQRRATGIKKESLERKIELEKESELINAAALKRRDESMARIEQAPWYDPNYPIDGKAAFKWQVEGALRLPERALLGDKRGLGKTLSSLIWRRVHDCKRTLVCLRKEVAEDFIKEVRIREPHLFVYNLTSANSDKRGIAALLLGHQDEFIVIVNIESWRRDAEKVTDELLEIKYDSIILDEAHNIKNAATGTAKGFMMLSQNTPKVLELTGTPIKNRPQEMYTLLHSLYPEHFPRESKFKVDYCVQTGQNKWAFSEMGLKSLVAKISAFYMARSPDDEEIGRTVPPPKMIEYQLDFDNHPLQQEAYKTMTERSMAILGSGQTIPIVSQLAIMTRQAQVVSWPAGITFKVRDPYEPDTIIEEVNFDIHQSVKMDWAEELIKQLVEEGERVLLFSRFKPAIYELRRRLESEFPVAVITGDEKANNREIFNDFDLKTASKTEYKWPVLLATYQTVGESANLNAARHMVLYDRFWNPGNEDQAIGRIDRINSVDQATVHVPLVASSIDEYMTQLIDEKRNIVREFKDASTQQASLMEHLRKTL